MRTVSPLAFVALFASSLAPGLSAQADRGALVRVTHGATCCKNTVIGTLHRATDDSIVILVGGAPGSAMPVTLARQSVRRIERGEQVGARMLVGAGVGLLLGAAGGAAIGATGTCGNCDGAGVLGVIRGAMVGAPAGLLAGTLFGAFIPHYEWEESAVPLRLSIVPVAGSFRVRASRGH